MKKIISMIIASVLTLSILCGCQANPAKEVVVSKNDGAFEEKIDQTLTTSESEQTDSPTSLQWLDQFTSTDGSVSFNIDINEGLSKDSKQVIEVAPHSLTSEDIKRVAETLLGDVTFYERRPSRTAEYSKSQYQEKISRLAPYTNRDALVELMGENKADTYSEYIQRYIASWTKKLESAQEDDPRVPCNWTLKKERHYNNGDSEIGNESVEEDADVLLANAQKDGIEYIFSALTKSEGSYKVNRLNLNLTEGLGLYPVDMAIYRSMVCRTEMPTGEQIEKAIATATHMLEEMQLGQWYIYATTVDSKEVGDVLEYTIKIVAAPSFDGEPVLLGQNLGSKQDAYIASYPTTYAEFAFSANSDLLYFNLDSPLDIVETRNKHVATFSTSELMDICKQNLSYSDAGAFGLTSDTLEGLEEANEEKIICQVTVSKAEYGLGRMMVANSEDHYYYIPVLVLRGVAEYIGEQSGHCYYASNHNKDEEMSALIWINAVDGSIIN